tara:strand:+ start:390 stop:641 length:252 start_codon:yes stop_codon:yes gene_type:complete
MEVMAIRINTLIFANFLISGFDIKIININTIMGRAVGRQNSDNITNPKIDNLRLDEFSLSSKKLVVKNKIKKTIDMNDVSVRI